MIGLNDFGRQWADTGAQVLQAVEKVGSSGWYILGQSVKNLEQALAASWGLPHAIGVASGLDALELSLRTLGCGAGDFVLTSPISAFATPLAILKTGATPVFADCDEYGLLDLEACEQLLARRPEIRFLLPVHLFGFSLDLSRLAALRDRFALHIVEDCAQSIGASWQGTPTGSVGQLAATSFYPTKNLGAMGDGGAVLTHSEEHAASIRRLRDYGQSAKYVHDVAGYNSRLDELQAAILHSVFLPRLPHWLERRREVARTYLQGIHSPGLQPVGSPPGSTSTWHLFPVRVEPQRKPQAIAHFRARGILVGEHYPTALIEQRALPETVRGAAGQCPQARAFCASELSLPIHPYLLESEVLQIITACNEWR